MGVVDAFWFVGLLTGVVLVAQLATRIHGSMFAPVSVYVGINGLSLAAYHLVMIPMHQVTVQTHVVVLISLLSFLSGALMARSSSETLDTIRVEHRPEFARVDRFFYAVGLVSAVGWVLPLLLLIGRHGLFALMSRLWLLQSEFQMRFIGYLNLLGILVLPAYILKRNFVGGKRRDHILVASALFGLLLAGIKAYITYSLVAAVLVKSVLPSQRLQLRHAVIAVLALVAFFTLYDRTVDVFVVRDFAGSRFPPWLSFLQRPYYYFTGSWPAMDAIVAANAPREPVVGYVTLQPLWKLLADGGHLVRPLPQYYPYLDIGPRSFNVYSFAGEVYWDFGIPGVIAFSLLLGYLATRLYEQARRSCFWGDMLLYGVFAYGLFLSFFAYYYKTNMVVLLAFVLFGAHLPGVLRSGERRS